MNYTGVSCPVCSNRFEANDDVVVCPICGAPHHRECYASKKECTFEAEHAGGKEWQRPDEPGEPHGYDQPGSFGGFGEPIDHGDPDDFGNYGEHSHGHQYQYDRPPADGCEGAKSAPQCHHCGNANTPESIFCQICGTRLTGPSAQQHGGSYAPPPYGGGQPHPGPGNAYGSAHHIPFDPQVFIYGGVSPSAELEGEKVKDIAAYIGPGSSYYLPRFQRLSETSTLFSVNISAFFLSIFYFFYRKMYVAGAVLLLSFAICLIPYSLYVREMIPDLLREPHFMSLLNNAGVHVVQPVGEVNYELASTYRLVSNIMWMVNFALITFFSMMANSLYYRRVIQGVRKIREEFGSSTEQGRYEMELSYGGGVSMLLAGLAVVMFFGIYMVCSTLTLREFIM